MKCVKLAVADGDPASLKRYVDSLSAKRNISIVVSTADGAELIQQLSRVKADVVMTGLALQRLDGFGVLEAIRGMPGAHPRSLVFSQMNHEFVIDMATRLGADYFLIKPMNMDVIYRRICQLAENGREEDAEQIADEAERQAARKLLSLGIPASKKGYQCLLVALTLCQKDGRYAENLSGQLYPEVARRLDTTTVSVERAMRSAIHAAWKEGGFARYAAETGDNSFAQGVPTTGKVIRRIMRRE